MYEKGEFGEGLESPGVEVGVKSPIDELFPRRPSVTAHAGCLGTEENSLASFLAAFEHPVDYVEADVRFDPEGRAYLSHILPDPTGAISFEDLLRVAAPRPSVRINADMKEYAALDSFRSLIAKYGMEGRILLTGVTEETVPLVRKCCASLPYMLNHRPSLSERYTTRGAEVLARRIADLGAVGLNTHHALASPRIARELGEVGLALSVWTVDAEADMRRVLALGAHNVTTKRIDLLLAMLGREAGGGAGADGRER